MKQIDRFINLIRKIVYFLEPDPAAQIRTTQQAAAVDMAAALKAKGWVVRDRRDP